MNHISLNKGSPTKQPTVPLFWPIPGLISSAGVTTRCICFYLVFKCDCMHWFVLNLFLLIFTAKNTTLHCSPFRKICSCKDTSGCKRWTCKQNKDPQFEFLILMCTCHNDWGNKNKPHTGVTALTCLCMLTSMFVAWKFMCINHYKMLNYI